MTNKPIPVLRRTKEQVEKDNDKFSNCVQCGEPLRKAKQRRDSPKTCSQCRYERSSGSSAIRLICKKLKKRKVAPAEDEMMFEDHPNGDSDKEGRVIINPTFVNYGISPLSEVIKTSNYQYKNGSARDGYRYKRSE